jgi:hypothetical protein
MPVACPVCGGEMPPAKPRGRAAEVCNRVCAERARLRRRKAAKLLEFASHLEELAKQPRGSWEESSERLRERAARLREDADLELGGVPL